MISKNLFKLTGLTLTIAISMMLPSCNDDSIHPNQNGFSQLESEVAVAPQSFTINANVNNTIHGAQGTLVNIPANSFQTLGGTPVTGNVTFYLTEIYDNNQMALNNKSTFAGSRLLVSGGVLNLAAYQGTQRLVLSSGINVLMPVQNTSSSPNVNMQLFCWGENDSTSNPTDSTWVPQDSSYTGIDSSGWTYDSSWVPPVGWYYNLYITDLTWINCDAFWGMGALGEVQVDAPTDFDYSNTRVYLILTGLNSAVDISYNYGGCLGYEFCTGSGYAIPVGYSFAVASIHYDSGTSSYTQSIVTGQTVSGPNNVVVMGAYTATTVAQFESDVLAL